MTLRTLYSSPVCTVWQKKCPYITNAIGLIFYVQFMEKVHLIYEKRPSKSCLHMVAMIPRESKERGQKTEYTLVSTVWEKNVLILL